MTVRLAAVDLGASSGRVVLGEVGPDVLRVETVARFRNDPVRLPGGLHWNVLELYERALDGLGEAVRRSGGALAGAAVDAWAVDYGLLGGDGGLLGVPHHYRDERHASGVEKVHAVAPPAELYARNGLQFLPFTTLYQLAADPRVPDARRMLLVPDLLASWMTGAQVTERTNASTTGLLDVGTGRWDDALARRLGLPSGLTAPLVEPGDEIGAVLPPVGERIGRPGLRVTAVGSHDTASAVVGVPLEGEDAAYVSCGTWGLVGVETDRPVLTDAARRANFTNEGGVDGRVRFLTNVMGLWLLNESMRAWEREGRVEPLADLLAASAHAPPPSAVLDVRNPAFLAPGDMPERVRAWYRDAGHEPPRDRPALVRAIVEGLAQAFADAVDRAAELTGRTVRVVHVVGGGALNRTLCQATADRSGRTVVAGPVEATAIGNLLVQARTAGALRGGLEDLRTLVATTCEPERFTPRRGAGGYGGEVR